MPWILGATKWIMLVSGLLTCTMLYAAIDPRAAMASTFGESIENPAAGCESGIGRCATSFSSITRGARISKTLRKSRNACGS